MHSILEIISEATDSAGPDLISLADLKLALGITDTSKDVQLQAAITMQSRIIAEYCDRRFGLAEAVETFTLDRWEYLLPRQALVLSLYPVTEIVEITTTGVVTAEYNFDPRSGRLWTTVAEGRWGGSIVEITYSGGFDLPEQSPARLQKAVIEAVRETITSGSRDPSIRELQHGDTRVAYFTSALATATQGYLSAPVADLVQPYRRLSIA